MSRQRLGQHFLADAGWRRKIAERLPRPVHAGDTPALQQTGGERETWIEIGAGHGEMTRSLASTSRRIVAVETDPRLAEGLRRRIAAESDQWPGVEVIEADILKLDLGALLGDAAAKVKRPVASGERRAEPAEDQGLPRNGEKFRVYGNLPYYITSPILHRLFQFADRIASIHVVVQLEVAARMAALPGGRERGYLSVLCQFYAKPEIALRIPPGAFRPPPKVGSALVNMAMPGERESLRVAGEQAFLRFVQQCFAQKRKTLRSNLRAVLAGGAKGAVVDSRIRADIERCGIAPEARAEELAVADFARLFREIGMEPAGG